MIVDLPGHFYCFPVNLEDCVLRPDLVIWNPMSKQILLFELTIPLEENIVQAAQFKESCYKPIWMAGQDSPYSSGFTRFA